MSPEDMEKRRQRRQAQQKKQRAQQRRLRLGLAAAVVVLALCTAAIYYFAEKASQNAPSPTAAIVPTEETTQPTQPTQETRPGREPTTTIHIRAAGDLNVTDSVVDAGLAANGFDFTRAFQDVASTLVGYIWRILSCGQCKWHGAGMANAHQPCYRIMNILFGCFWIDGTHSQHRFSQKLSGKDLCKPAFVYFSGNILV